MNVAVGERVAVEHVPMRLMWSAKTAGVAAHETSRPMTADHSCAVYQRPSAPPGKRL